MSYFRLFDLPGELRTAVLEHLVIIHSDIPVFAKKETCTESPPMVLTDLLLVSHQMHREASGLFYTMNNFIVNLASRRMLSDIVQEGQLFGPDVLDARRRIRSLSLRVRRISGDLESVAVPTLTDMILHGNLRILDVGILTQSTGLKTKSNYDSHHRPGSVFQDPESANLVRTSPFQALLGLLADPDLEKVTLWASLVHWSIWCPYHDSSDATMPKNSERVILDWQRLVHDFADGNRITKFERPRFG
ncbi:hypothetical protein BKA67DRAFT_532936 [Truncatella angustata]|uniref:Uncharacterized protein n=1 Tax=Truncatella angustata TaxID=152316 RepID=A0A9P8UTF2_9PEZI|nr:uncharacterized protein BKA67DRAFT_532936 [Truncatella angustata]KAH6657742.1 hypothetical protein BKA67DRAFT_532936 [Truncatella angustata]